MKTAAIAKTPVTSLGTQSRRAPRWVIPVVRLFVVLSDSLLAAASFILAFVIREGQDVFSATAWAWSKEFVPYAGILLFAVPARLVMLAYHRIYRFHGAFSYVHELSKIFTAVFVSSLLIVAWAFLFRGGFAFRDFSYSRSIFLIDFVLSFTAIAGFHLLLRYAQTRVRRRDINLIPTLVVGTNSDAEQTVRELRARTDLGYRVVGVVRTGEVINNESRFAETDVVGGMDSLSDIIRELEIQEVIITDGTLGGDQLFEAMMQIGRRQRVEFRFAPSLLDVLPQKTSVEQIGVLPMVRLFRDPLSDIDRFLKRASDVLISALALVLLAPLWLLIAILIRFDSPGPVLFRQERVGMDGRIFLCYKFRSMKFGTGDELHREVYRKNIGSDIDANTGNDASPVFGKVKDDPRITRVGKWLRRSSLDELPQLLNVLKGDMSVVGPRPPIPYEVEEYELRHRKRLDMKPGMTGLWQVSGRSRLSFEEMVRIDLYYIENWSLWLDLKIILLTLPAVFRGDGAR